VAPDRELEDGKNTSTQFHHPGGNGNGNGKCNQQSWLTD
jgi:hypothetical protein